MPSLPALTYRVPDALATPVAGARVLVPLGTRIMTGVVVASVDSVPSPSPEPSRPPPSLRRRLRRTAPSPDIKEIIDVLDDKPFLPEDVLRLVQWTSEYYACGAGEALAAAMPPRAWIESERHAQITAEGVTRSATESGARGEILQALSHGKPKRLDSIARRSGSYAAIAALERDGLVIVTRPLQGRRPHSGPFGSRR